MNGVGDAILGGWNLSTIALFQTGPWQTLTITAGNGRSNINMLGRGVRTRPDRVGNGNPDNPAPDRYYDPSACTTAPAGSGRFGNARVRILEGPCTIAVSACVSKHPSVTCRIVRTSTRPP